MGGWSIDCWNVLTIFAGQISKCHIFAQLFVKNAIWFWICVREFDKNKLFVHLSWRWRVLSDKWLETAGKYMNGARTQLATGVRCCCCYSVWLFVCRWVVFTNNQKVITRYLLQSQISNRSLQSNQNWSTAHSERMRVFFFTRHVPSLSHSLLMLMLGLVDCFLRMCCECASEVVHCIGMERVHATQSTENGIPYIHSDTVPYTHTHTHVMCTKCPMGFSCARTHVHVNANANVCCCCFMTTKP